MLRATQLSGRAVVDMDAAEKMGKIERVILDLDARRVAGFVISRDSSLLKEGTRITVPAAAVHAVGPDAVIVHRERMAADAPPLDGLPRAGDLIGRKVVTQSGRLLGAIDDVLIDAADGRIVAYTLADHDPMAKIGELINPDKKHRSNGYLRADTDLRTGQELVVVPDDAVTMEGPADRSVAVTADGPVPVRTSRWAESHTQ